ncbi:uncharacterized protein LOC142232260 [Haematobia irritans]|uniref:uncharacterized protein LOC142232260 n=1 Tax=Haematobia irritans TaxID=7368 RepID=UPI003F500D43
MSYKRLKKHRFLKNYSNSEDNIEIETLDASVQTEDFKEDENISIPVYHTSAEDSVEITLEQHLNAAIHVLKYLGTTSNAVIKYKKSSKSITGFCDANWAQDVNDRKSQSGFCFILANGVVSWESKKQKVVATSSAEAEYIALTESAKEALYLSYILEELGFRTTEPIIIHTDSQSAQQMAKFGAHHSRTKHIHYKYHFIKDTIERGLVELKYLPSESMVADFFTKPVPKPKHYYCYKFLLLKLFVSIDSKDGSDLTEDSKSFSSESVLETFEDNSTDLTKGNIESKLKNWIFTNIRTLTQKSIDDILMVLRSEGYTSLPICAKTFLGTSAVQTEKTIMKCSDDTLGEFKYFGIFSNLSTIIDPRQFHGNEIDLLIHVDGMEIFNKSKKGFWTIMGKVFSRTYNSKPFLIALFFGNSKPYSAREFLAEFVAEANELNERGVYIQNTRFQLKVLAFSCDMPARAFLKCCKGHTGFYSCERCTVKGETVDRTRVFNDTNCKERTLESFKEKANPEHHTNKEISPLLDINNFDLIKFVLLDEMHMLYLGVSKYLIQNCITKKSSSLLSPESITVLQQSLFKISNDVSKEFQRKTFHLHDIKNWKATQFKFFLLYAGGVVLKNVMKTQHYKQFLILYTACRILSSKSLATMKTDYAKLILKTYVELMPNLYGLSSLTMNFHNLIHIADDVHNMHAPISSFSAFEFENSIGFIKSIIKSPNNPISQINRKLQVFHSENSSSHMPLLFPIGNSSKFTLGKVLRYYDNKVQFSFININQSVITPFHPDNVCLLKNRKIFLVSEIFSTKQSDHTWRKIFFKGKVFNDVQDFFDYPTTSSNIGVYKVGNLNNKHVQISISLFDVKCIHTTIDDVTVVITLLHQ